MHCFLKRLYLHHRQERPVWRHSLTSYWTRLLIRPRLGSQPSWGLRRSCWGLLMAAGNTRIQSISIVWLKLFSWPSQTYPRSVRVAELLLVHFVDADVPLHWGNVRKHKKSEGLNWGWRSGFREFINIYYSHTSDHPPSSLTTAKGLCDILLCKKH